jgi:mono/diheme cytochrome c family protein
LEDIGGRAGADWLKRYLATPHETMPGTTMPNLLLGMSAPKQADAAESLTHYLLSKEAMAFRRVMPDRAAVARGEILYHRIGCVACHAPQNAPADNLAGMPAATLPRMSEKWSLDGLRRFLLDPLASRPSGRMPTMRLTDGEATDIAHYLLRETRVPAAVELAIYRGRIRSLEDIDTAELARTGPAEGFAVDAATRDRGSALRFTGRLRIDLEGDYTFYFTANGASRLSIDGKWIAGEESWEQEKVDAKTLLHLTAGPHEMKVDYVHRGEKPPALKLEWEGPAVARGVIPVSRLRSEREPVPEPLSFVADAAKAAKGRALYAELNCAVCHEAKTPANPPPPLSAMRAGGGCLAEKPAPKTPDYHLDATRRNALRAAIASLNRAELPSPTSQQRVEHAMATFNCMACHARDGIGGVTADRDHFFTSNVDDLGDEGRLPPQLDGVGDKLRPEWLGKVLEQGSSVRTYMNTRMPQFGAVNVRHLADLFVALDRHALAIPSVPDTLDAQRDAGRTLVGTNGLSCIVCHRFNRQPAQTMQITDLTTATERLNEDWFRRFLLDPNRFHPGTRMPALWPDGQSPMPRLLGGNTDRQQAAIWTYLAEGSRAKFPEGLSRQNMELAVGGEAVVYRGKLWEAGFRAVAVGYPGRLNVAFDAEEMRLSLLWRGRFLNAAPHWSVQGMGQIRPLGTDVVVFPHGPALAVLADAQAPWPTDPAKSTGMKFRGYQLDVVKRPTLLYAFGSVGVEDFLTPAEANGKSVLRRSVRFTEAPPQGLHMRLAAGKLAPAGENAWRFNDSITLRVTAGASAFVRGKGDRQELLVPVNFRDGKRQLEVEYAW